MKSAGAQLRESVEAWHRRRARAGLLRWRDAEQAAGRRRVVEADAWLLGHEARDALQEAASTGELDGAGATAMASQLGEIAAERAWADALDRLQARERASVDVMGQAWSMQALVDALERTDADARRAELASALESHFTAQLGRLVDASQAAERARREVSDAPMRQARDDLARRMEALAERVLADTADAGEEAARHLMARAGRGPFAWHTLWRAMRASRLDDLTPPRERWRRLARSLRGLEVRRELDAHLRAEPDHGSCFPSVDVLALEVPRDVRLAPSRIERGVVSELRAAAGFGRALARVLCNPGLPVELRRAADPGVADALGALLSQLLADPVYLRRSYGLEGDGRDRLGGHAAALHVLELRASAAWVVASGRAAEEGVEARVEKGRQLLHDALGIEAPAPWSLLVTLDATGAVRDLRSRAAGLALHVGLREAWDEDWFRNPRIADPLRAACARGGLLDAEGWCREARVTMDAAFVRIRELLA